MYILLAILWLLGGGALLSYQGMSGDHRLSFHIGETPISAGWAMILLSGYNCLRWWSRRSSRPASVQASLAEQRQRVRRLDESRERDPNFLFTEEPPPTDAPPHS
jgi:hypothetical protein